MGQNNGMEPFWGTGLSPVIAAAAVRVPSSSVGDIFRGTHYFCSHNSHSMWRVASPGPKSALEPSGFWKLVFSKSTQQIQKVHSQLHCLQSSQPSNTFLYKQWTSVLHNYSKSWTSTTSSAKVCRLSPRARGGFLEALLRWGPLVLSHSNELSPLCLMTQGVSVGKDALKTSANSKWAIIS